MQNNPSLNPKLTAEIATHIKAGTSTCLFGIPSAGIGLFLKHIAEQHYGFMIYVDVFSLPRISTHELYKVILTKLGGTSNSEDTSELVAASKIQLAKKVTQHGKVVLLIPGFDQFSTEFSATFFQYLRSLHSVAPAKVIFVFGLCRPLSVVLPTQLINTDFSLFTTYSYLTPYSPHELRQLLHIYGPKTDLTEEEIERQINLSGGHFQFLQLLLTSEHRNNPTTDPFIRLAFKNIYSQLSNHQRTIIKKLAINGMYRSKDNYLTNVGIIKKQGGTYVLFSELFVDSIRTFQAPKLPIKEKRLLAVLKKNLGFVVPKQVLFDAVWQGEEIGSEWALNALMYRLRKHPAFATQGFTIENYKKIGYILIKG
jgi:hypothetical protein